MGEIFDELFIFFLIKKTTNQFLVSFNKNQKKKSKKCCDKKRKKIHTLFCCSLTFSPPYPPNDYLIPSPLNTTNLPSPHFSLEKCLCQKKKEKTTEIKNCYIIRRENYIKKPYKKVKKTIKFWRRQTFQFLVLSVSVSHYTMHECVKFCHL